MASDLKLTAAGILAHVLETCGIRTGTTIDRKDLENMAASLDDQLSALIAAAKRVEAAERQKRIACGVADKLGERLRASNARATAAEARVGELTKALEFYADRKSYDGTKNLIDGGWGGSSLEAHSDVIADRGLRARVALDAKRENRLDTALGKEPRPTTGESLIAGLTDLRDTLQRGESLGAHYKITYHNPPRPPGDTTEPRP